jgi:predicted nucleic acid-binding protein
MKLLLDTSAIISYVNGDGRILQEVEKAEIVCTSSLCAYETLVGSKDDAKVERLVAALMPLPFTFKDSKRAAAIYGKISKSGRRVNVMDVLICSQALERGLAVLTRDRDFAKIRDASKQNFEIIQI